MSYRVYISHSPKDLGMAEHLARSLRSEGVGVFRITDGSEDRSDAMDRTIHYGLRESDEVIVLLTDNSANSPRVIHEIGAADSLGKRVTPIVVNEGVEQMVPMIGKNFIKYADLSKFISSLKRRAKAA